MNLKTKQIKKKSERREKKRETPYYTEEIVELSYERRCKVLTIYSIDVETMFSKR